MNYSISQLTLEEKLKLLTGRNAWQLENANGKLPDVWLSDGPHGLRMTDPKNTSDTLPATAMPSLSVLSNTWDTQLAYLQGSTIADDCIENGADVLLAPGVNVKRTPLCGRNFEYFSEDPFLAGMMAKSYIEGVQSKGIGTSLKHFCANNREFERLYQTSEVDERTLREIYLPAFEIALEAQPWTVMCSYNLLNGVWASENKWLLHDVLKQEFGFTGLVVSDWCAVHHGARAVKATLDLRMPFSENAYEELKNAYESGWITEEEIDARVEKVLELIKKTQNQDKKTSTTKEQRHEIAVNIAKQGAVLLKNDDDILPLRKGNILVCDPLCDKLFFGGGGSAYVSTNYNSKPLFEELSTRLGDKATVSNTAVSSNEDGYLYVLRNAFQKAYGKDAVVLCLGTGAKVEAEAENQMLTEIVEVFDIILSPDGTISDKSAGVLDPYAPVSMNMWGFYPDVLDMMNDAFCEFLRNIQDGDVKAEYPLPSFIGKAIDEKKLSIRVYTTNAEWFGVTYAEDRPAVSERLNNMKEKGIYPTSLKL